MALVDDLGLHRNLHLQSLGDLAGGIPSGVPDQLAALDAPVAEYEAAVAAIARDQNLTELGRQNARADARTRATTAIEAWRATTTGGVAAQEAQQTAALRTQAATAAPKPSDAQVQHMVQVLPGLDPLEVLSLHVDASDDERRAMEVAVEQIGRVPRRRPDGSVTWETLLPPERVAAVRAARLEQHDPAVSSKIRSLQRIARTFDIYAGTAIQLLK